MEGDIPNNTRREQAMSSAVAVQLQTRMGLWRRKGGAEIYSGGTAGSADNLPVDGGLGAEVWREGLPAWRRMWGIAVGRRPSWPVVDAGHTGGTKDILLGRSAADARTKEE
jgi:hypothetical protein